MRVITTLASALAVFACTQSVWAQGVSDCNAAIVKNNAAYSADLVTKLAFLETITQDSYQKITDGKDIGVTLPIEDIPVTFNGNWNSFQEQRNNVFSHYKYDFASSSAVDWTNSYLSPLSPQLYQTCIDGLHPVGAHIWIRKANPTGTIATIVFSFYTAEGDSKKRSFMFKLPEVASINRGSKQ